MAAAAAACRSDTPEFGGASIAPDEWVSYS